ncbi:hypothetical protein ABEB36_013578 [Hypothenemus hampei]|uniref:Transposable element P transposase-like RNase H C-terminal domain-containing protein n=1 Tax=Hypothenemus hampei TaxID=57062 RepID=A0ABD1E7E5_HYPHA
MPKSVRRKRVPSPRDSEGEIHPNQKRRKSEKYEALMEKLREIEARIGKSTEFSSNESVSSQVEELPRVLRGILVLGLTVMLCSMFYHKTMIGRSLLVRHLNQDCLENLFGCVRSHLGRNINLSPDHFLRSFKTLLINNLVSTRSAGFNCEDDQSDGLLTNLKDFFNLSNDDLHPTLDSEDVITPLQLTKIFIPSKDYVCINITNYVAGFAAKKIHELTKLC